MKEKTLYISDLDGTLLSSACELTPETTEIINSLIEKGLNFTISTARTGETVRLLAKDLNINIPAILMNGVATYNLKEEKYTSFEPFPENATDAFFEIIKAHGSLGFLYTISDGALETYYVNTNTPNAESFMEERIKKFLKKFTRVADFSECAENNPVYYSVSHRKEALAPLYESLKKLEGFSIEFYRDIYNTDFWYLEICSEKASKYSSAVKLKEKLGFERIVAFGDNLNDLPLFKAADESFAVNNAKDEVKAAATAVIGSNNEGGVALYLKNIFE